VEYPSKAWEITSEDTIPVITPVGHGNVLRDRCCFFCFVRLVLFASTEADTICEAVQREKVAVIPSVPAIITSIVNPENLSQYDLSCLKTISVGGAPSTPGSVKAVWPRIDCKSHSGLGSVEGTCAATRAEDGIETVCYKVGKSICPYDTLKIIDLDGNERPGGREGELVSKRPEYLSGISNPQKTTRMFSGEVGSSEQRFSLKRIREVTHSLPVESKI